MMRILDIFAMALGNLWQRKLRTCLNLLGIVIGCTVLLLTAAAASGVGKAIHVLFDASEFAKEIRVSPDYYSSLPDPPPGTIVVEGEMSDERRERIREVLVNQWKMEQSGVQDWQISLAEIEELKQVPHVVRVVPNGFLDARLNNPQDNTEMEISLAGVDAASRVITERVIAGSMLDENARDQVLVSEVLAYQLGFRSDSELHELVGRELTITYQVGGQKYSRIYENLKFLSQQDGPSLADQAAFAVTFSQLLDDLDKTSLTEEQKEMIRRVTQPDRGNNGAPAQKDEPAIEVQRTFQVCGIVNSDQNHQTISDMFLMWFHGSHGDLLLHHEVAVEMQSQIPERKDDYYNVAVIVDSSRNLKSVTEDLKAKGLDVDSALMILDNLQRGIERSRWYVLSIAAAILLASALGISNTLVISVLQRTPEFGILKAVGARDRDLLLLMLCEGALLGVIGATLAVAVSWLSAKVGQTFLARHLSGQNVADLSGQLLQFQLWAVMAIYGVAVVICVAASLLPAWRAARLDPVVAMRRD